MRTTVLLLSLCVVTAVRAETPCVDCWTDQCKEGKGAIPKCKQGTKPAPAPGPKACPSGQLRSRDTQGRCCWPAQSYNSSKGKCIGGPECPPGSERNGEDCSASAPKVARPSAIRPPRFDVLVAPFSAAELERESAADAKRDEKIEAAKRIIPKVEDGNLQKADLLFVLAEMYWEKSRYLYRRELAGAGQDHRESRLFLSEVSRINQVILREYPTYDRSDEVMFDLADNHVDLGERELGLRRYQELVTTFPKSKFVADAQLQVGHLHFEIDDFASARGSFERAASATNPRIRATAIYRIAWCDAAVGELQKALSGLLATIELVERQPVDPWTRALKKAALTDSVRVFVELNQPGEAITYYRSHAAPGEDLRLITKLGLAFQEARRHDQAIKIFSDLLRDNPLSELAHQWDEALAKSRSSREGEK